VQKATLGQDEELAAHKRLDRQAPELERHVKGPSFAALTNAKTELRSWRVRGTVPLKLRNLGWCGALIKRVPNVWAEIDQEENHEVNNRTGNAWQP